MTFDEQMRINLPSPTVLCPLFVFRKRDKHRWKVAASFPAKRADPKPHSLRVMLVLASRALRDAVAELLPLDARLPVRAGELTLLARAARLVLATWALLPTIALLQSTGLDLLAPQANRFIYGRGKERVV